MACPAWPGGSCLHHGKRPLSLSTPQAQTTSNTSAHKLPPAEDPAANAPCSEAWDGTSAGQFDGDGKTKSKVQEAYAGTDTSGLDSDVIVSKKRNVSDGVTLSAAAPLTRRARSAPNHFNVPPSWQFVRVLGSGVSGFVAAYKVDGQDYAVKKIPGVFSSPARALRILREVKLLKHLNHFNIVKLHELYFEGPSFEDIYLRMELLESNLTHFISVFRHALSEHQLLCILFQILRALCCMHTAQILHRDVKPDNVLLTGSGHIKLADLGLSRAISARGGEDEEPLLTACVVSQFYRAPEVALHPQKYSFPIDIWSVGCIFAELISLEVLFKGKDSLDQVRQIVTVLGMPKIDDIDWIPKESAARGFLNLCHGPNNGRAFNDLLDAADSKLGGNTDATDLLKGMLQFHPDKRPTSKEALFSPCMQRFAAGNDPSVAVALDAAPADTTWEREFTSPGTLDILAFRKSFLAMRAASSQDASALKEEDLEGKDASQKDVSSPSTDKSEDSEAGGKAAQPQSARTTTSTAASLASAEVETPEKLPQQPQAAAAGPPTLKRESRSSSQTYSFLFPKTSEGSETRQSSRKERSDGTRSQRQLESSPPKSPDLKPRQHISTGGVSITRRSAGSVVSLNLEGKGIRTLAYNKPVEPPSKTPGQAGSDANSSGKACSARSVSVSRSESGLNILNASSSNNNNNSGIGSVLSSNGSSNSINSNKSGAEPSKASKEAAPVKRRTVQVNLPPEGLKAPLGLQQLHRSSCSTATSSNAASSSATSASTGPRSPVSGSGEGSTEGAASSRLASEKGRRSTQNHARRPGSNNSGRRAANASSATDTEDGLGGAEEDYGLSPSALLSRICSTSKPRSSHGNLTNGKMPIAADAPGRAKRESLLSASTIVTMITQATQGTAYPFMGGAEEPEEDRPPRSPVIRPRRSTPTIGARSSSTATGATTTSTTTTTTGPSKTSVANFI